MLNSRCQSFERETSDDGSFVGYSESRNSINVETDEMFKQKLIRIVKHPILLGFIVSIIWFFIGIFFVDNRWWWFVVVLQVLGSVAWIRYKKEIHTQPLAELIHLTLGWLTVFSFVFFLLCAIFLHNLFVFGIYISIVLFIFSVSLEEKTEDEYLYHREHPVLVKSTRRIILLVVAGSFVVTMSLFFIPSVAANSIEMPANSYDTTPHKEYVLYGGSITDETINREHVYAKSWFKIDGVEQNQVNDLHNVIWSNESINSLRANKSFGYSNDEYTPEDEWKGDVARALLYMYITYGDTPGFDKAKIDVGLMKTWARMDPVSDEERALNEWIIKYSIQKNSNPFVEHPWLIGFIIP